MSVDGGSLSIISIGVSCQTAIQIRQNAQFISDITNSNLYVEGSVFEASSFPFDWRIMPSESFCKMASEGVFFPKSAVELDNLSGKEGIDVPPYWKENNCYFWHDFRISGTFWNVEEQFLETEKKYSYLIGKFLNRSKRTVFVLSNTQNNLDYVSKLTGLEFSFDRSKIEAVKKSIEILFPKIDVELIVVTTRNRVLDAPEKWPCSNYIIDHSNLIESDVNGDFHQWRNVFKNYFLKRI